MKIWLYMEEGLVRNVLQRQLDSMAEVQIINDLPQLSLVQGEGVLVMDFRIPSVLSAVRHFARRRENLYLFGLYSYTLSDDSYDNSFDYIVDERFWMPFRVNIFVDKVRFYRDKILKNLLVQKYGNRLEMDALLNTLKVSKAVLQLSALEFKLLELLLLRNGGTVGRAEIITTISSHDGYISASSLSSTISRIRRKFAAKNVPIFIRNVNRRGYMLIVADENVMYGQHFLPGFG